LRSATIGGNHFYDPDSSKLVGTHLVAMQPSHQNPHAGPAGTSTGLSLSPPEPFPLLSLPREIRDQIYRFALLAPGKTPISRARSRPYFKDYPTLPLNVLLVLANRQIHSEASRVLYGENVFEFGSTDWFYAWYRAIGATHQPLVRRLLVQANSGVHDYFDWAKALRESGMSSLCEVCIVRSYKAYRERQWTERTWDMVTDTFEEERMNAHVVEFGEREGIERKVFLIGFDEGERETFVECRAGWPVDMSDEQMEVLNGWYHDVLVETARKHGANVEVVMDRRTFRAPGRRRSYPWILKHSRDATSVKEGPDGS
jgi:hypothetical protein